MTWNGNDPAIELGPASPAGILALVSMRYPLAVGWCVVSINVDPLDGIARRTRPHVLEKVFKGFPAFAYENAAAAIAVVIYIVRICASAFHVLPASVFGGRVSFLRSAMAPMCAAGPSPLIMEAPTRSCVAGLQEVKAYRKFGSAVAPTNPQAATAIFVSNGNEATEPLPSDVDALQTPAGTSATTTQGMKHNRRFFTAIAQTKPTRHPAVVGANPTNGRQSAETLICDIQEPGHSSLLERLRCQVTAGRSSALPLRFIA